MSGVQKVGKNCLLGECSCTCAATRPCGFAFARRKNALCAGGVERYAISNVMCRVHPFSSLQFRYRNNTNFPDTCRKARLYQEMIPRFKLTAKRFAPAFGQITTFRPSALARKSMRQLMALNLLHTLYGKLRISCKLAVCNAEPGVANVSHMVM